METGAIEKAEQLSETLSHEKIRNSAWKRQFVHMSIHIYKLDERRRNNSGNVSQESENKETQTC